MNLKWWYVPVGAGAALCGYVAGNAMQSWTVGLRITVLGILCGILVVSLTQRDSLEQIYENLMVGGSKQG